MARAWGAAALAIAAGLLSGCGTAANISVGFRDGWQNAPIYGGVRRDVQSAQEWATHSWTSGENVDYIQNVGTVVGLVLVGIDVPLSAVGDTITLPLVVPASLLAKPRNGTNGSANNTANPPAVTAPPPPSPPPPSGSMPDGSSAPSPPAPASPGMAPINSSSSGYNPSNPLTAPAPLIRVQSLSFPRGGWAPDNP
jgi:uncharacterized protein YceK